MTPIETPRVAVPSKLIPDFRRFGEDWLLIGESLKDARIPLFPLS